VQDDRDVPAGHERDGSPSPGSSGTRRAEDSRSAPEATGKRKGWRGLNWRELIVGGFLLAVAASIISGVLVEVITTHCLDREPPQEEHIRNVIVQEATLTLAGDVDAVIELFAANASVYDFACGSDERQRRWIGQENLRERYDQLPHFEYLEHAAIQVTINDGKYATATSHTQGGYYVNGEVITIPDESSCDGERWSLEKIDGTWKIVDFTYNVAT